MQVFKMLYLSDFYGDACTEFWFPSNAIEYIAANNILQAPSTKAKSLGKCVTELERLNLVSVIIYVLQRVWS